MSHSPEQYAATRKLLVQVGEHLWGCVRSKVCLMVGEYGVLPWSHGPLVSVHFAEAACSF